MPRMYSRRRRSNSSNSSTSIDDTEIPRPNHRASAHQAPRHYSSSSTLENNDPEFYSAVSSHQRHHSPNRLSNIPRILAPEDEIHRQFLLNLHRTLMTVPPACQAMSQLQSLDILFLTPKLCLTEKCTCTSIVCLQRFCDPIVDALLTSCEMLVVKSNNISINYFPQIHC